MLAARRRYGGWEAGWGAGQPVSGLPTGRAEERALEQMAGAEWISWWWDALLTQRERGHWGWETSITNQRDSDIS